MFLLVFDCSFTDWCQVHPGGAFLLLVGGIAIGAISGAGVLGDFHHICFLGGGAGGIIVGGIGGHQVGGFIGAHQFVGAGDFFFGGEIGAGAWCFFGGGFCGW